MTIILDTNILVWYMTKDRRLSKKLESIIVKPGNLCFISIASLWELSIKFSLGRIGWRGTLSELFETIENSGFELLQITPIHLVELSKLPDVHQDPFDRLIIAQAISENFAVLSSDEKFEYYPVKLLN